MIDENSIRDFINSKIYDIRISRNGRFMDQKCIPDVLNAVAECVIEYVGDDLSKEFTKDDIWHFDFSRNLLDESFSKPDTESESVQSEYDKFFAQPLKLLAAAEVLNETKQGNRNVYLVTNFDVLDFISKREKNALFFLDLYLTKTMADSGCHSYFEEFFTRQDKASLDSLRDALKLFYEQYTPITGDFEPPRIYNKIINILAFRRKKCGCIRGSLSKYPITIDEIRYNRLNWRDIDKPKGQSRKEYAAIVEATIGNNTSYYERNVQQAIKFVKELEQYSEVHRYPQYMATEAHHIFMKSEYPELADMPENIIALTGTEHYSYAHPERNTQRTDPDYQMICLISKLDSIERNFQNECNDYSLEDFAKVLNVGLNTTEFNRAMGFEQIKAHLLHYLRPVAFGEDGTICRP